MAGKYYAVRQGRIPGIYRSWEECKNQVSGYSGAVYKSFFTLKEAKDYLAEGEFPAENAGGLLNAEVAAFGECSRGISSEQKEMFSQQNGEAFIPNYLPDDQMAAYVDGSYKLAAQEFSYGAVIFFRGESLELSGKSDDPDFATMRNVAGEIMGAVKAMRYALEQRVSLLHIYHDYEGIAQWCLGGWQAKNKCTQTYRLFYLQCRQNGLAVEFHKVKGHSGIAYNERADELAKAALGIEK